MEYSEYYLHHVIGANAGGYEPSEKEIGGPMYTFNNFVIILFFYVYVIEKKCLAVNNFNNVYNNGKQNVITMTV